MENIILMTDSYKASHFLQYPDNISYIHDYIESRGGKYGYTKFFGLQYYLKEYLSKKITVEMVEEANDILKSHGLIFNYEGWMYIAKELKGNLPLKIRAVPEGAIIKNHNVLMTVESTDTNVPWVVSWFETLLLKVWYPTTVATFSYKVKKIISHFYNLTVDNSANDIEFKFHDFGYRGVSSEESAGIGGLAHLTTFKGTDNLSAIIYGQKYYNCNMAGYSIPAAEHSTITSWGSKNEELAYKNLILKFDNSPISIVCDSYDYFNAIKKIFSENLKDLIIKRDNIVVIRPDSGDPITTILYGLNILSEAFGYKVNSKGYKILNKIRLIQGDGIHEDTIWDILKALKDNGYSAENISFGCGGALLQGNLNSSINRDTHKFAMKCSCIKINGKFIDVFKDPITDKGKISKKGRLDLIKTEDNSLQTVDVTHLGENNYSSDSILELVYENGKIIKEYSLDEIRKNEEKFKIKNFSEY